MSPVVFLRRAGVSALALTALGGHQFAGAQDISVSAGLRPETVGVDQTFTIAVSVTGAQGLDQNPAIPDISDFADYLGQSSQTSVQIAGGSTTITFTVEYRYRALREGSFSVPAFNVRVGGEDFTTQPLALTITPDPQPTEQAAAPGFPPDPFGRSTEPEVGPEQLFLTATPSKTTVHEGEPLIVEYRIWTLLNVSSLSMETLPDPDGFWVEDLTPEGSPQVEELVRDGRRYATAVVRRVALIPSAPGARTVDPLVLEAMVRGNAFDVFAGMGSRSVPVSSNALDIEVEPLPPGAPPSFTGVVGSLSISASLDRDSVTANEAVTLTVRASGRGNLGQLRPPDLGLPADFEVFPPESSESIRPTGETLEGTKRFDFVIIPRAPGTREIPPISLGYLDDATDEYRVSSTSPLPLTVSGEGGPSVSGFVRSGISPVREDIRFIHLEEAPLRPIGGTRLGNAWFWVVLFVPLAGVAAALGAQRRMVRVSGDIAYARGRKAGRLARKHLARARSLTGGDAREFYGETDRALRGFVANRLNLPEAGLRTPELASAMRAAQVDKALVDKVVDTLDRCDLGRFAGSDTDVADREDILDSLGSLMPELDRGLRR